jgi:hypothetical protein
VTKYSLTERQKEMLRSIVPGLEAETIFPECIYLMSGGQVQQILSVGNNYKSTHIDWPNISESDFADFESQGLLKWTRNSGQGNLNLYTQKIIDAVKSNFDDNEPVISTGEPNSITVTPLFGAPATVSQYKADMFVMMPFKAEMKHVYDEAIRPAAQSLNLSINRGDDFFTKHPIMTDIWSAIYHCRVVIADCTGKNANVFYELGLAHTIGKPVIMVAQNENDIPFDVQNYRRFIYSDTQEGIVKLTDDLKTAISKILQP